MFKVTLHLYPDILQSALSFPLAWQNVPPSPVTNQDAESPYIPLFSCHLKTRAAWNYWLQVSQGIIPLARVESIGINEESHHQGKGQGYESTNPTFRCRKRNHRTVRRTKRNHALPRGSNSSSSILPEVFRGLVLLTNPWITHCTTRRWRTNVTGGFRRGHAAMFRVAASAEGTCCDALRTLRVVSHSSRVIQFLGPRRCY